MAQIGDCLGCTCTYETGCKAEAWNARKAAEPVREAKPRVIVTRKRNEGMAMVRESLKAARSSAKLARKAVIV